MNGGNKAREIEGRERMVYIERLQSHTCYYFKWYQNSCTVKTQQLDFVVRGSNIKGLWFGIWS